MPRAARLATFLLSFVLSSFVPCVRAVAQEATTPRTWQGTLGARRVVLELFRDTAGASALRGRWFDRTIGVDHDLRGRWHGDTLALDESDAFVTEFDFPEPASRPVRRVARWRLVHAGGVLQGTRAALVGTGAAVRLAPVSRTAAEVRRATDTTLTGDTWTPWAGHDVYEALRADAPLVAGPVVRRGTVAWRALRDARTGIAVPTLVAHPDPARLARANAALDGLRRHAIGSAFACAADLASRGFEGERTTAVPDTTNRFAFEIVHADARLLTLEIAGSVFCGGAHPSNVWTVRMLDLASGRVVHDSGLVRPERRRALERLVRTRLDARAASGGGEADCPLFVDGEPVEELRYAIIGGRFTVIQVGHPHVAALCDGSYGTVPRTLLRDIVHPWVLGSLRR